MPFFLSQPVACKPVLSSDLADTESTGQADCQKDQKSTPVSPDAQAATGPSAPTTTSSTGLFQDGGTDDADDAEVLQLREDALQKITFPDKSSSEVGCEPCVGSTSENMIRTSRPRDTKSELLQIWTESYADSVKAMLVKSGQKDVPPGGDWPLELSLLLVNFKEKLSGSASTPPKPSDDDDGIETQSEIAFVAWRIPGKCGRIIETDENDLIVATNPTCRPFDAQTGCPNEGSYIILPATGVAPHKSRRADRPSIPPSTLRLKQMFETALSNQEGPVESLEDCYICKKGGICTEDPLSETKEAPESEPVSVCPFCLRSLHFSCACAGELSTVSDSALLKTLCDVVTVTDVDLKAAAHDIHQLFLGDVCCHLCKHALRISQSMSSGSSGSST